MNGVKVSLVGSVGVCIPVGRFQEYDYGPEANIKRYGQSEPPTYDLRRVTAPVSLHYAKGDLFVVPQRGRLMTQPPPPPANTTHLPLTYIRLQSSLAFVCLTISFYPFSFEAVDKLDNSLQTEFLDLKYDCEAKIIFKQSGYELGWDVRQIYEELANPIGMFEVPQDKFNHLNFILALRVKPLLFDLILELLSRY
uniref:Uncharacterized protein n=1 Tax=Timema monikensis TaxID=170555 RepID=A0A7R9EKV0_9NEOP|nr:unnamed protein product [Timema monikensis]